MTKMVWTKQFWGKAVKIYKSTNACFDEMFEAHNELISYMTMSKADAVKEIRDQIWDRQKGECINCGGIITSGSMHLHEKNHRGQGGTYSLENDEGLCADCHLRIMHPEKQLNFGKNTK